MAFTSMAFLLEQCRERLERIAETRGADNNRFSVCARALFEILACLSDYDKNVVISRKFVDSLAANAEAMLQVLSDSTGKSAPELAGRLDELAFQMVEELAVIVREKTMRSGLESARPGEVAIMDYFERRGFWFLGDQTLVTEYYYTGLPIALMRYIFRNR